jgi:hypothetical protein
MDEYNARREVAKGNYVLRAGCKSALLYRYLHLRFTVNYKTGAFG